VSRTLRGIGVSPGVAVGPALIIRWDFPEVPDRGVRPTRSMPKCAACGKRWTTRWRRCTSWGSGCCAGRAGGARIFDAQILMAQDQDFLNGVETLIRNNQLSAETAYEFKALELRNLWSGAARLRERLADLHAIQLRMITRLLGKSGRKSRP
jgi:phosphotransferase system enzyme I (PtsI)